MTAAVGPSPGRPHLVVIGAGWAGLAAAVDAVQSGWRVTLLEAAGQPGGRARSLLHDGHWLDNGQHILIGAYRETLRLMREVGVSPEQALHRRPLELVYPNGHGLRLPKAPPLLAFASGVWRHSAWPLHARLALLKTAARWGLSGFRCAPARTVAELTAHLPAVLRDELIDPLCVAALNTPSEQASGTVFLRVLKDALFSGHGSADLLLPRWPLQALLPQPAQQWLLSQGAEVQLGRRVQQLAPTATGWQVDELQADRVVLACSAVEAARLAAPFAPAWAAQAAAFRYEPIVTVTVHAVGATLALPMLALHANDTQPAQFVFDLGLLGLQPGRLAFVISGARPWVDRGLDACAQAVLQQARRAFPHRTWAQQLQVVKVIAEKRATFACVPDLKRPASCVLPGLAAAGDYVQGPYPATLEGAVRSGRAAAQLLLGA